MMNFLKNSYCYEKKALLASISRNIKRIVVCFVIERLCYQDESLRNVCVLQIATKLRETVLYSR